jgi:outer membrane lipoprotein-sorting protein
LDAKAWTPVQIRITARSNDTTDYKYSNVRLNKGVSDSVFKLNIPKDAVKQ